MKRSSDVPVRTRLWRSKFLRTVARAKRSAEFRVLAKQFRVCPLLLAEYLSVCVETWSSSDGRAIFPLRRTVAEHLGCSIRHVGRLRAAAVAGGWETTVGRYYRDASGATKRSSNTSRFHLPALYVALTDPAPEPVAEPSSTEEQAGEAVGAALSRDPEWEAYMEDGALPARRRPVPPVPVTEPAPVPVVEEPVRSPEQRARGEFAAAKVAEMRRVLTGDGDARGRGPD